MKKIEKKIKLGDRELKLETGHVAEQADGAVMASYGETVILATVVAAPLDRDLGYFPLSVEYQEKLYAGGRIKGSRWVKREGRPGDDEILTARLVDRSIRPLFPKDYKKDVQVILTVLSVDLETAPEILAGIAASAAIEISSIPWEGPVSTVKIGMKDDDFVINPVDEVVEKSDLDLTISFAKDAIVMIESDANEVPEEKMTEAIEFAEGEAKKVTKLIQDLAKEVGNKKEKVEKKKIKAGLKKEVKKLTKGKLKGLIKDLATKKVGYDAINEMKSAIAEEFEEDGDSKAAKEIFEELMEEEVRSMINSGKRPDGRKPDELRDLSAMISVLPRTHGSAIFNRGQTQALSIATLGAPSLEQLIESAEGEETKRYIHHYSMPPYSVGETGRVNYPGRREIGHGALAERALLPMIPSEDDFPYTIRVVSEILSSNGSTSMASVCGSTLSLMDAGVPIKKPIGGIAMGLIIEDEKDYKVLTDIVGIEDGNGDMDFKVAGSRDGITALQMDVKTLKVSASILKDALKQAKEARMQILDVMEEAIDKPRDTVSEFAPVIKRIQIDKDKIGDLIGPGGKMIKAIIEKTGAQIDVDEDGTVFVSAIKEDEVAAALERIEAITKEPKPGEIYEGEAKRIQPFGVFVEILPGKEGLVHISDMSEDYVKDPGDLVSVGDKFKVRVKEIDDLGRLNLSMILDESKAKSKKSKGGNKGSKDKGNRGNRNKGRGKHKGGSRNKSNNKGKGGGPHFPKSRLMDDSDDY